MESFANPIQVFINLPAVIPDALLAGVRQVVQSKNFGVIGQT